MKEGINNLRLVSQVDVGTVEITKVCTKLFKVMGSNVTSNQLRHQIGVKVVQFPQRLNKLLVKSIYHLSDVAL